MIPVPLRDAVAPCRRRPGLMSRDARHTRIGGGPRSTGASVRMDPEQLRSAEDAGLTIICGSIAVDDATLRSLGIDAEADGDDVVRAAAQLSALFNVDLLNAAGSLADIVQELKWWQEAD